ncbi:hypothetical protein ACX9GQ_22535 [Alsobacter sp. R-9]
MLGTKSVVVPGRGSLWLTVVEGTLVVATVVLLGFTAIRLAAADPTGPAHEVAAAQGRVVR